MSKNNGRMQNNLAGGKLIWQNAAVRLVLIRYDFSVIDTNIFRSQIFSYSSEIPPFRFLISHFTT